MFTWIGFCMTPAEFTELIDLAVNSGDVYFLPDRSRDATIWSIDRLAALQTYEQRAALIGPSDWYYLWDRNSCPLPLVKQSEVDDYFISYVDGVHVAKGNDDWSGNIRGRIEVDDYGIGADGSTAQISPSTVARFEAMRKWIKQRSTYVPEDGRYVTNGALQRLLVSGKVPEWAAAAKQRLDKKRPPKKTLGPRVPYQASFQRARDRAGLEGDPKPKVRALPRYHEETLGPSWFRTAVGNHDLQNLTLPGLYIGRSDVREVSFAGSDLHLSAFNWSDFEDCDFSRCDLSRSDLRACNFRNCRFTAADLSRADLRNSGFEDCDFVGARLDDAILMNDQKDAIALPDVQASGIKWTDEYEEPEGG